MGERHTRFDRGVSDVYGPLAGSDDPIPDTFYVIEDDDEKLLSGKGKRTGANILVAFSSEKAAAKVIVMGGKIPYTCVPRCMTRVEALYAGFAGVVIDPPMGLNGGFYKWHLLKE